jgi:hypothetical protein
VVRDILEHGDVVALHHVAQELRALQTRDGETAGWAVAGITSRSFGERMAVAAYALRAL